MLPVNEMVLRNDRAAVEVEFLRVYPNGFTIHLLALPDPHEDQMRNLRALGAGGGPEYVNRQPRVGVRFADGRTAGREADWHGLPILAKDADGMPTEPIVRMVGGGGGSGGYHFSFWVYPLPPEGPVEIYLALPAIADGEAKVTVDGDAVRTAAQRARVIWA